MLLELEGFSKRFGRITALADVGFHVEAGEVLGLIGPNGAGKFALFECLAGVLPSDRGVVRAGIVILGAPAAVLYTGRDRGEAATAGAAQSITPSDFRAP